ncbi:MAG: ferrous iron transport protein A [Ruminococcus sp.]|nr:ferrous iron transport protein A [Ruminococcus sp.]
MVTEHRLSSLNTGESCIIHSIEHCGSLRRRLMELGFVPGAKAGCLHRSSGMTAFSISGTVIALRRCDSEMIKVSPLRLDSIQKHTSITRGKPF